MASISSRMICSTLRWTRQPSGRNVQTPPATWRMNPPRTRRACETASASAGASRRVGRKSWDARAIIRVAETLFERDLRGLGHRERGRLGHLQALRPGHPLGDPLVDLGEQLVDQDVGGNLLQHAPVGVDEADVAAAGDAEVGVARLAGTVDGAAEDRDLEVLAVAGLAPFDLLGERLDADVVTAAARAGDHHRPPVPQSERRED